MNKRIETRREYVQRIAGTGAENQVIAEAAGINTSQVSRSMAGVGMPSAKPVIAFVRHYGRPPIEALIAAGYREPGDVAGVAQPAASVTDMSVDELVAETRRRRYASQRTSRTPRSRRQQR